MSTASRDNADWGLTVERAACERWQLDHIANDPDAPDRLDALRPCEAATLFVSFEPLIGPVDDVDLSEYEWAIVGGESGPDHREMDHRWARAIRDQCERDDVAFFFKQSAGRQPEQGQALVEANLTRTVHRELPDLPAITQAARGERPPAAAETKEVSA